MPGIPLVVIELAGSGHNEGFLLVLLLLATWLYIRYVRTHRLWLFLSMLIVFGLAISTNLLALLLAPLYLWFDMRKSVLCPALPHGLLCSV